jgi:hypothetical protein
MGAATEVTTGACSMAASTGPGTAAGLASFGAVLRSSSGKVLPLCAAAIAASSAPLVCGASADALAFAAAESCDGADDCICGESALPRACAVAFASEDEASLGFCAFAESADADDEGAALPARESASEKLGPVSF